MSDVSRGPTTDLLSGSRPSVSEWGHRVGLAMQSVGSFLSPSLMSPPLPNSVIDRRGLRRRRRARRQTDGGPRPGGHARGRLDDGGGSGGKDADKRRRWLKRALLPSFPREYVLTNLNNAAGVPLRAAAVA